MLSEEKLNQIKEFLNILDQMIDGKYILADVKIHKLIKAINECDELYKFMTECLIGFDFEKEYSACQAKNRLNAEDFTLPREPVKIVALVYCLLNAFNSKYLDLYDFMRENFSALHYHTEYIEFGRKILEPFKNLVASYFGINNDGKALFEFEIKQEEQKEELKIKKEETSVDKRFYTIEKLLRRMLHTIENEAKIKYELKENLKYILNRAIYALNYQDIELITPLITIFEMMTKKLKYIAFDFHDLKIEILSFYNCGEEEYDEDDLVTKEELEDYMQDAKKLMEE